MKKTFTLLVALLCFSLVQAGKVDLKLDLKEGKTYRNSFVANSTIKQEMMGQNISIDMKITGSYSFMVKKKMAENYEIEGRYESMSMDMKTPMGSQTFSSDGSGDDNPAAAMLKALTEGAFTMIMTDRGKVLEVTGLEEIFDELGNAASGLPENQRAQLKKQINDSFGPDALASNLSSSMAIFPDHPVAFGDSWEVRMQVNSGVTMNSVMTYTLTGEEGDFYLVSGKGTMKTADGGVVMNTNGMDVKLEMNGELANEMKVDKKTGWMTAGTGDMEIIGKTKVDPSEQLPNGMEIPMSVTTTFTYSGE